MCSLKPDLLLTVIIPPLESNMPITSTYPIHTVLCACVQPQARSLTYCHHPTHWIEHAYNFYIFVLCFAHVCSLKPEHCLLHPSPHSPLLGWVAKVGGYGLAVTLPPGASFVAGTYHVSSKQSWKRTQIVQTLSAWIRNNIFKATFSVQTMHLDQSRRQKNTFEKWAWYLC